MKKINDKEQKVIGRERLIRDAVGLIREADYMVAFTGAGISVDSGVPAFRGKGGLWEKYDSRFLELEYFYQHPRESWRLNKEIFYYYFDRAQPNAAHKVLSALEEKGILKAVITQNIDNLHQEAGSRNVLEFHGNSRRLTCIDCGDQIDFSAGLLARLPPLCENCGGVLKPDIIFFGEQLPEPARTLSFREAGRADLVLVIGTTGEVEPAALIPYLASENGAKIIEVNLKPSRYSGSITDIFLEGSAAGVMEKLGRLMGIIKEDQG